MLVGTTFAPLPPEEQLHELLRVTEQVNLLGFFLHRPCPTLFPGERRLAAGGRQETAGPVPAIVRRRRATAIREFTARAARLLPRNAAGQPFPSLRALHRDWLAQGHRTAAWGRPGAASDDEWQARVLGWMKDSSLIIMYSGTTQWVNWELRQVVESGRATSLILMFPEIKGWRPSRRKQAVEARVEQVRRCSGTRHGRKS